MTTRSIRHRLSEAPNIWPGFVDVLATLLIVIIFILMVFTVSQIYLSDAISGRDKALEDLRNQINELSKILVIESKEKQQALEDLSTTESKLKSEQELTLQLESEIAESKATISTQVINISLLSDQITNLLVELRIVAKALETYEGIEVTSLDTKGLGERINKALATRIDQLNLINEKLSLSQQETAKQLQIVQELNENLMAINESLGLDDAGLVEQLEAIRKKNTELALTNEQLTLANHDLKAINESLGLDDAGLVEQLEAIRKKNTELALTNEQLTLANHNLKAINESLGLDDASLVEQLEAIRKKNTELALANEQLEFSKQQISEQLKKVEELNIKLTLNEEELQNQVKQYQKLTEELIALNDSLDLKDQSLIDQLELIKNKNTELALLNEKLIKKDTTIFDLRGKILELNNILSISEETKIAQTAEMQSLSQKISALETESVESIESLVSKIANLEKEKQQLAESADAEILEARLKASSTLEQVAFLTNEIEILKNEIHILNSALESSELDVLTKKLRIEDLGERLNKALTSKVFELQKYRSEFFGRLQSILGDRKDIKVVGDRFIFESELLFDSGSASLQFEGKEKLKQIGLTLKETTMNIPDDIDWIIQVEGHTDKNPINTAQFPSNWELSTARAITVLELLLELGFNPQHLSAAGYGEFYPISDGESSQDFQQNRRIELKLTSR